MDKKEELKRLEKQFLDLQRQIDNSEKAFYRTEGAILILRQQIEEEESRKFEKEKKKEPEKKK